VFSPANGNPIVSPSQDIVMGVAFLTEENGDEANRKTEDLRVFKDEMEAMLAFDFDEIDIHEHIQVRLKDFLNIANDEKGEVEKMPDNRRVRTTVGRIIFNEILPERERMPFYNCFLSKKGCARVIDETYERLGKAATIDLLDAMKEVGFKHSTTSGLSFGVNDLRIPAEKKQLLDNAQKIVDRIEKQYQSGAITERERHNALLDVWATCRKDLTEKLIFALKEDRRDPVTHEETSIVDGKGDRYLNPVYLFMNSGARGNNSQMQQLAGMRGLMAKPSGEIIETPIRANFREGLNVLEYFSSTHGARKGLADTALKTADSGYLTRKLCDVAQSVVVIEDDCGTNQGIAKRAIFKGEEVDVPLADQIIGRTSMMDIRDPIMDVLIVKKDQIIDEVAAKRIDDLGIPSVHVRSPLTCFTPRGVCASCYGRDLSTGQPVEAGLAVGIIAAQSIGEPGTQLTMRTFHTGGTATRSLVETSWSAPAGGIIKIVDCNEVEVTEDDGSSRFVALKRNGEVHLEDDKGREIDKFKVPYGATLRHKNGTKVSKGSTIVEWNPHMNPILAEKGGVVQFENLVEDQSYKVEKTKAGKVEKIVTSHTGDRTPQIKIVDEKGESTLDFHHLPANARIEVEDGDAIVIGRMLARVPKGAGRSADIVGGLPRVTEIFEARIPKDPAVMAEISGRVELDPDKRKGKMAILIHPDGDLDPVPHYAPQGTALLVHTGDRVDAGDRLTDGPLVPADILKIKGEDELHLYMLDEVQNVYRAQGVPISDKHIEVILRQMLGKVKITDPGDSDLLPNDVVDKWQHREWNNRLTGMLRIEDPGDTDLPVGAMVAKAEIKDANDKAKEDEKAIAKTKKPRPVKAQPLLLGITKASLQAESFLSGASFQETTKVLTEASLKGAVDTLRGLKENVLLGHLIPAGTGFSEYTRMRVKRLVDEPEVDLAAEMQMRQEAALEAERAGAERRDAVVEVITPEKLQETGVESD
jgi:DNA-directed RNA polymerase subunit beta'